MASVAPRIASMGESCTLHTRVLGARDAVTKQPAVTYTDSTIKIAMKRIQTSERDEHAGRVSVKLLRCYVGGDVTIAHLDRLTVQGILYEVESVPTPYYLRGSTSYFRINGVQIQ